jgi:transcription antitermination protein NusB
MLSRRHLRIKVLQSLYAFIQSGNNRLDLGERQMLQSIDKLYEQCVYMLSFVLTVFDFAEKRNEDAKNKYLPTAEDLSPNTRFVDNLFIKQMNANRDFRRKEEQFKINWKDEEDTVRKMYIKIKESEAYQKYMTAENNSYKEDKEFVLMITQEFLTDFEPLEYYFEERDIYWASDYFLADWLLQRIIKSFKKSHDEFQALPSILKTEHEEDNEDLDFIKRLYRKTIIKKRESDKLIEDRAKNWDIDRIATMDKLILEMAVAELVEFESIPIKVSMNEYIELAKIFSTAKSRVFINGILDRLIEDLGKEGQIVKTGRGLMS